VGEGLFALDKKSQGKYLPVELEQGIVGQLRPGLDLNLAILKISKYEREPLGNTKKRKVRESAKKSRNKATLEAILSQQSISINIEGQPIFGEDVMAGNTYHLEDHEAIVEEIFGYTAVVRLKTSALTNPSQNLSKASPKTIFLGILDQGKPFTIKGIKEMDTEMSLANANMKICGLYMKIDAYSRVTRNRQETGTGKRKYVCQIT
jgi:hypothetical protein